MPAKQRPEGAGLGPSARLFLNVSNARDSAAEWAVGTWGFWDPQSARGRSCLPPLTRGRFHAFSILFQVVWLTPSPMRTYTRTATRRRRVLLLARHPTKPIRNWPK